MDTKEKIYKKASELFLKQGYDNTPMSHIAKALGLSKAGLYHHYPSKENLLFDIINYFKEKDFDPVYKEAVKIPDPEERLIFFLRKYTEILTGSAYGRITIHEARRLKPYHFKKTEKVWRMTFDIIKNAISEMQALGKAKDINSAFAAFAVIGMCTWTFYWFDYTRKESGKELSEVFLEIFLKGITKGNE